MRITFRDATGTVKINYLQSLILLYLPCETFSASHPDGRTLTASLDLAADGNLTASVTLTVDDRTASASESVAFDPSVRLFARNHLGRTFLKAAETLFGYRAPWGVLTGIRPAKLAAKYRQTESSEQVEKRLTDEYLVRPGKAKLAVRTAETETRLVEAMPPRSCSLYVSIPFCPTRCRYCSFVSTATPRLFSLIPAYLERLKTDLAAIASTVKALDLSLLSIYIGGGTPAILSPEQTEDLLAHIERTFPLDSLREYTFEAGRPDCITKEKLQVLRAHAVNRISVNTQTASDEVLRAVGRSHTFADYARAMVLARAADIPAVNTDLIAGLPGESVDSFRHSLDSVLAFSPENITVHAFTLKKSSEFRTENLAAIEVNSKAALAMTDYASETLHANGYAPYYLYRQKNTVGNLENAGFARPGFEGLYNIYMMGEYHTVFSAGAGAVTKYVSRDGETIKRVFCPKYPYEYLDPSVYGGFDAATAVQFYETSFALRKD